MFYVVAVLCFILTSLVNIQCKFEIVLDKDKYDKEDEHASNHALYGLYFGIEIVVVFVNAYLMCINHLFVLMVLVFYIIGLGYITYDGYEYIVFDTV